MFPVWTESDSRETWCAATYLGHRMAGKGKVRSVSSVKGEVVEMVAWCRERAEVWARVQDFE